MRLLAPACTIGLVALLAGSAGAALIVDTSNPGPVASIRLWFAPQFTVEEEYLITRIWTYHWYQGDSPIGQIWLAHSDGTIYGPWDPIVSDGVRNQPNVNWDVYPDATIKPGTYIVWDSALDTWSHNAESGHYGFARVEGRPAMPEPAAMALLAMGGLLLMRRRAVPVGR